MSEDTDIVAPVRAETAEARVAPRASAPAPRPSGVGSLLSWLLVLAAVGAAAVALWRVYLIEHGRSAAQIAAHDALVTRIDELARTADQRKRDLDSLRSRIADADGVNKSVREELLALGERSRHLEDAVANLAEQRQSGRDALAMNEAEFLLQLAQERLNLFHDAGAAAVAYKLADSSLAAAEDPVFASARQTIAAELQALDASKPLDTQATLAALERLRAGLPALAKSHAEQTAATPSSGWQRFLSQFVRISHDDAMDATATRDIELTRTLVAIDIRAAESALLARDDGGFKAALKRVRDGLAGGFDGQAAPTRSTLAEIDRLAAQPLAPALPELGSALKELRNLRATRALSQPAAPRPAAAVPEAAASRTEARP